MTSARACADGAPTRPKRCEGCGEEFDCRPGACWCADAPLDAETLTAIRQEFSDCLCPACLRARATRA